MYTYASRYVLQRPDGSRRDALTYSARPLLFENAGHRAQTSIASSSVQQATCDVPTATGYVTTGAAGTATITGFAPSGVTCAAGYTGTVTYTVCGSAGTDYTLDGCEATLISTSSIVKWRQREMNC